MQQRPPLLLLRFYRVHSPRLNSEDYTRPLLTLFFDNSSNA